MVIHQYIHVASLSNRSFARSIQFSIQDAYIQKVREVSRRQLAVAGYRLADLLMVARSLVPMSHPWVLIEVFDQFLRKSWSLGLA